MIVGDCQLATHLFFCDISRGNTKKYVPLTNPISELRDAHEHLSPCVDEGFLVD